MNERIKELLLEAAEFAQGKEPTDYIAATLIQAEKFAELIIKECVEIVMEDKSIVWADSIRISFNIKENFGVE